MLTMSSVLNCILLRLFAEFTGVTYMSRNDLKRTVSPESIPLRVTTAKPESLMHTAQLNRLKSVPSKRLSWFQPFPAVQLVFTSPKQLVGSQSLLCRLAHLERLSAAFIAYSDRKGASESHQF